MSESDKKVEDKYWELDIEKNKHNVKISRIEQARRNVEALARLLGYCTDDDKLGNKELLIASVNKNMKVMEEVVNL